MTESISTDVKAAAQIAMRNGALAPQNFEGLWRMSQIMAASGFMPRGMERVEAVFVAVQFGLEVGLSPMQAVQNIAPINGRPAIWGDAMLGLVRASGYMDGIKEDVAGDGDDMAAICQVWRKGEDNPVTHRFSVSDAKRAQLWGKQGPWTQYPRRMLQMRARGFCLRDAFPDVLKGLYAREELEGEQERYMGAAVVESNSTIDQALLSEAKARQQAASVKTQEADDNSADLTAGMEPEPDQEPEPEARSKSEWPRPNADGELVDVRGIGWIEEIHSSSRRCTSTGQWRMKRGADPALVDRFESQAIADLREQPETPAPEPSEAFTLGAPAESDERERVKIESGGRGFSFGALRDEADRCETEDDIAEVQDLMRSSELTDHERGALIGMLAEKRKEIRPAPF